MKTTSVERFTLTGFSILFLLSVNNFAAGLSIDEYINQVITNNPTILASQYRVASGGHKVSPAAALDDPFFAVGVDEIPFGDSSANLRRYQLNQSIPYPGKRSTKRAIAKSNVHAAEADLETLKRQLIVIATQAYYRTYYNQKSIELNKQVTDLVKSVMESSRFGYQTGSTQHHEWLLGKIELASFLVEREKLLRENRLLQQQLGELLGNNQELDLSSLEVNFDVNVETTDEQQLLASQPELQSLDYQERRAAGELELAKLAYYPDFVLQLMAMEPQRGMDETHASWGFMVGVNIPIFYAGKQSEMANSAQAERMALELEQRALFNRLRSEIINAQNQLSTSKDIVNLYRDSVIPATDLAVDNARGAYQSRNLGLDRYLSLLKVQRTQKLELLAAKIDVKLAITRINQLLSSPPIMRMSPSKPSLFGTGEMANQMNGSSPVKMGEGMNVPAKTGVSPKSNTPNSGTSMSGM